MDTSITSVPSPLPPQSRGGCTSLPIKAGCTNGVLERSWQSAGLQNKAEWMENIGLSQEPCLLLGKPRPMCVKRTRLLQSLRKLPQPWVNVPGPYQRISSPGPRTWRFRYRPTWPPTLHPALPSALWPALTPFATSSWTSSCDISTKNRIIISICWVLTTCLALNFFFFGNNPTR